MKVLRSGMDTKKSLPVIQVINFYTNEYNTTRLKMKLNLRKEQHPFSWSFQTQQKTIVSTLTYYFRRVLVIYILNPLLIRLMAPQISKELN